MKYTYLIKNGHVVDPARGIDRVEDVYVLRSKIVEHVGSEPCTADEVVDATGCLVLPGLIDSHLHLNHRHTDYGIQPDVATFPYGITAGIDAGTAGSATFDGFYKNVVSPCTTTIKSFINITAIGVAAFPHNEIINPDIFDVEPERIKVLPFSLHEKFDECTRYTSRGSGDLSCNGTFTSLASALIASKKLVKDISYSAATVLASCFLALILGTISALFSMTDMFSASSVLIYNLVWLGLMLIMQSLRKYG